MITRIILASSFLLMLIGCDRKQSSSYNVTKANGDAQATFTQPEPTDKLIADAQQFGMPTWEVPEGWEAQPVGAMRKGSWLVRGEGELSAEISVLAFPGDVGGDLANTNRWAQQIGMDPLSIEELDAITELKPVDGHVSKIITLMNMVADEPQGIVVAIVPLEEGTWFFKCMGDAALVKAQRKQMLAFLDTVQF